MKKEENRINTPGSRIRAAREELDMSQSQLATALGFQSATAISLIENGERGISSLLIQRIVDVLHRSTNYLLGQPEEIVDVKVALRADKDLSKADKDAILRFIERAKERPDAK